MCVSPSLSLSREDKIINLDNSVCVRRWVAHTNSLLFIFYTWSDIKHLSFSVCVCVCSSLPALVKLWLEEFTEDLRDSPLHPSLRLLSFHLRHRLCFRRIAQHADTLLHTFQEEGTHTRVYTHTRAHTYTHTHTLTFSHLLIQTGVLRTGQRSLMFLEKKQEASWAAPPGTLLRSSPDWTP